MTTSNETPVRREYSSTARPHQYWLCSCPTSICHVSSSRHAVPVALSATRNSRECAHGGCRNTTSSPTSVTLTGAGSFDAATPMSSTCFACRRVSTAARRFSARVLPLVERSCSLRYKNVVTFAPKGATKFAASPSATRGSPNVRACPARHSARFGRLAGAVALHASSESINAEVVRAAAGTAATETTSTVARLARPPPARAVLRVGRRPRRSCLCDDGIFVVSDRSGRRR
mmetsp:Transcript_19922/g.79427  ORF Transcript_19922/g.79427 Transcript_19922/m.79427 type:complete len:231 (-) Transcript_19922:15-707(-)